MPLTLKQRQFIDAYLGPSNGNATDAARRAGYSQPMQQGYENLRKPEISEEIDRRYSEKCMGADEVLTRLADQARGVGAYICTDISEALPTVRVKQLLEDGRGHLIKSVKYTDKGACNIEFYDAQAALIQIGRHHKLFTDRTENDDPGLNAKIERELEKLAGRSAAAVPGPTEG
jgi:hypothetical protein